MKKFGIAIAALAVFGMGVNAMAWNGGNHRGGGHGGYYNGYYGNGQPVDTAKWDAFNNDTRELQSKYAGLQAEYQALMSQANPDSKRAGELGAEMSRLNEQIRIKAQEAGLPAYGGMGYGGMHGNGGMHGYGCW